jgi:sporulation protein YlmC with PRC-barrel domain
MPRHDWDYDDTMSRDRSDFGLRERSFADRDRRAMFERNDEYRSRNRPIGGWGGLAGDEDRMRDRERSRRRDDERFGSDDYNRGVPMDETSRLIASNKVEGTPVFDRHGDKIGTVHNFMVDKRKGQVVYAVLRHGGGFLGLGERYYPLEWDQLTYDTRLEGYHVDFDEDELQNFGSFDSEGRYRRRRIRGERETEMSKRRDRW